MSIIYELDRLAGMELRQLEHFVAVADELNFTRAAARIHVVQSALSTSIAASSANSVSHCSTGPGSRSG